MKRSPGRYQELDLFIKVLRLLCPNLTDASTFLGTNLPESWADLLKAEDLILLLSVIINPERETRESAFI